MPLHVPQPPAPALDCVRAALTTPALTQGCRVPPAVRAAGAALRCETPLPVHVLDRVDRPADRRRTRLLGWRFLLRAEHTVGAAEARVTDDGWTFSHFCDGPYVVSTERALTQAETLPGTYRPRLLSVPALYMLMLWLHRTPAVGPARTAGDDGVARALLGQPAAADLLVPLSPAPPGVTAHQPYPADQLLPRLARHLAAPALATPA